MLIIANRFLRHDSDIETAASDVDNSQDVSQQLSNDLKHKLKLEEDELVKKYDGKVLPDYLRGKLWQVSYIARRLVYRTASMLAD